MRAYIVVDLGFGDAGKGLITDYLARKYNAEVVVRYNGGAQAGHNVVTPDGRHHTFAQFGSGTFISGVKTILSKDVIIHPGALLVEGDILNGMGLQDVYSRLRISDSALIITPFHQAANHILELARGDERHGSCGVGVGATYEDSLDGTRDSIRAGDLLDSRKLKKKLERIRDQKRTDLLPFNRDPEIKKRIDREWSIFEDDTVIDRWISSISRISELGLVWPDERHTEWLTSDCTAIFEGAQGVLLDADAGFHPHTTWSNCTGQNAFDMIRDFDPSAAVFQIGVLRSYAVRHGNGPLPTETGELAGLIHEHNSFNEWQGNVRYGWFDAILAKYALKVAGKMDALAVTHMDALSRLSKWTFCDGYKDNYSSIAEKILTYIPDIRGLPLEKKEEVTKLLARVKPVLKNCESDESGVIGNIESLLKQSVGLVSYGPKATDVKKVISIDL